MLGHVGADEGPEGEQVRARSAVAAQAIDLLIATVLDPSTILEVLFLGVGHFLRRGNALQSISVQNLEFRQGGFSLAPCLLDGLADAVRERFRTWRRDALFGHPFKGDFVGGLHPVGFGIS